MTSVPGRVALAAASGALFVIGNQPFALSAAGWIALAPLLVALRGASPRAAIGLGWLTGSVTCLGVAGYWIWRAAIEYFGLGAIAAALFTVAVTQVFVAPFFALFAWLALRCGQGRARLLVVPAAFVASELARAAMLDNPWELLGHSQRALTLLQLASVTGVYGLSFLLALSGTAAAELVEAALGRVGARRALASAAVAALVTAAVTGFGALRLRHEPADPTLEVLLVQGDIANAQRGDPARAGSSLRRYVELTQSVAPLPPLVLWPENAITVFPADNPALLAPLRELVARVPVTVLAGAPRAGERPGVAAIYNSVFAFDAADNRSVYDKRHLLPFVERFALRPQDGPYLPGDGAIPVQIGPARAGILLCYEVIFPSAGRELIANGANLFVNLSNDSWFDAGAGPAQHYELARFRAIEDGVSLVRATNTGISGAFDPHGRELIRLPRHTAIAAAVAVPLRSGGSLYAQYGDWFALSCALLAVIGILRASASPR